MRRRRTRIDSETNFYAALGLLFLCGVVFVALILSVSMGCK